MRPSRHARFYVALAVGLAALPILAAAGIDSWALRIVLAGNGFFLVYLALTALFAGRATAEHLRATAAADDEGLPLIFLLAATAVALSIGAIFLLLRVAGEAESRGGVLAVAGVPLGWLTLHTVVAFHYARLYYAPAPGGGDLGGLDFPGTPEPGPWEFLYFAFVIGMTAQVSDVAVRTTRLRRATLAHGAFSFFYNAVILALAVNAALIYAG
jgi:uncharacterized membrane protein